MFSTSLPFIILQARMDVIFQEIKGFALDAIVNGHVQLVYISPKSLLENKRCRSMLKL